MTNRRRNVQDAFMREKVRAIVATNAFGMGIDKPNVRLVFHYAMPGTLEAYYQEAGRAGRDGKPAACYLLHAFPDRFTHEFFIKGAYPGAGAGRGGVRGAPRETPTRLAPSTSRPTTSPRALKTKVSGREVESALRILTTAGRVLA